MNLKPEVWISWVVATATAALTMSAFAYSTFETKEHALERKQDILKRLESIEGKVDLIVSKNK